MAHRAEQEAVPPAGFTCPLCVSNWPWREMKTQHSPGKQPNPPCQHCGGSLHTQSNRTECLRSRFLRCFLPACILMCSTLHITNPTDVSALTHFRGIMFNRLSYLEMQKAGWCFSSSGLHKQHSHHAFDLGLQTLHKRLFPL